jgi:hypothetical protein
LEGNLATRVEVSERCPYLLRDNEGFYCRACNWGIVAVKVELGVCYRPLTLKEASNCLKLFKTCPDYKKEQFYERKMENEASTTQFIGSNDYYQP